MSPKTTPRPSVDGKESAELPMTSEARTRTFLFTLLVACGALSFGFSVGLTGPLSALPEKCLSSEFQAGDVKANFGWFASILNIGAMFGAVSGGVVADKLGRRGAFMIACVVSILGSCCIIFGSSVWILNAGRSACSTAAIQLFFSLHSQIR